MKNLSENDRQFFLGLEQSAFTNPFSDERVESDRRITGFPADASFDAVLRGLLAEVDRRLAALEPLDLARFAAPDRDLVTVGLLFQLYHRCLAPFDALIQQQIKTGDEPCAAPFAAEAFDRLQRCGMSRADAALYVAVFYQLRRAFYFIDRNLVGASACMQQLRKRLWDNIFTHDVRWYVRCLWSRMEDFSTLLLGETGTGKGAAAFAIGRSGLIPFNPSTRTFSQSFTRAFVQINLSQYPEALLESELFGHRKGAFTGAVDPHEGVLARCSPHGAIFLDEIGEVGQPVQIKLLQVLQQRTFSPVGSHEQRRFEGRVIAATNQSIDALRRSGTFRDDFYYRLCSDQITLPPLRLRLQEMPDELDRLVEHMLRRMSGETWSELQEPVLAVLKKELVGYSWPGNVRELEQAVRRILLTGTYAGAEPAEAAGPGLTVALGSAGLSARELVAAYCKQLYDHHGRYEEVARRTGLNWRTVKRHIDS